MPLEDILHFLGVHVEPAGNDELFQASHEGDVAVGVLASHVSAPEPALAREGLSCGFRPIPVPLADTSTPDEQLSGLAGRDIGIRLGIHDPDGHAGQGGTDRPGPAIPVQRIGKDHARLGHSVPFEDRVAEACTKCVKDLRGERG